MAIELVILPGVEMTTEQFLAEYGRFGIAIDGLIKEPSWQKPEFPAININHHDGSDRIGTRASCEQALIHVRMGLFDTFRHNGTPTAVVVANAGDQDIAATWTVINNGWMLHVAHAPPINRFVGVEGITDATGATYPFSPDMPYLARIMWTFEPYTNLMRSNPGCSDAQVLRSIVFDMERRIMQHLMGDGGAIEIDARSNVLPTRGRFSIVEEIGVHARLGLAAKGVRAFLVSRQLPSGRWQHTFSRTGPLVDVDLVGLSNHFNELEKPVGGSWGGGDTFAGSPRGVGSMYDQQEAVAIANAYEAKRIEARERSSDAAHAA